MAKSYGQLAGVRMDADDSIRESSFYLYACLNQASELTPSTAFYHVESEPLAQSLLRLFAREYANTEGNPSFYKRSASEIDTEGQVLLDETLDMRHISDLSDFGIYPSRQTILLVNYSCRAKRWEDMLRSRKAFGKISAGEGSQAKAEGDTDWRDVQRRLLELRDQGDSYSSRSDLAKRLGCSRSTIQKAIKPDQSALSGLTEGEKTIAIQNAQQLREWQARRSKGKAAPRATSLTEVVTDNIPQTVEADPSNMVTDDDVEKAMRHLIEEAKPEERAKLNDLDAEGRRAMAKTYYAHKLDGEPSPLEDDPPDKRPQKVKEYKRV